MRLVHRRWRTRLHQLLACRADLNALLAGPRRAATHGRALLRELSRRLLWQCPSWALLSMLWCLRHMQWANTIELHDLQLANALLLAGLLLFHLSARLIQRRRHLLALRGELCGMFGCHHLHCLPARR